jgi:hypothetical protein
MFNASLLKGLWVERFAVEGFKYNHTQNPKPKNLTTET